MFVDIKIKIEHIIWFYVKYTIHKNEMFYSQMITHEPFKIYLLYQPTSAMSYTYLLKNGARKLDFFHLDNIFVIWPIINECIESFKIVVDICIKCALQV